MDNPSEKSDFARFATTLLSGSNASLFHAYEVETARVGQLTEKLHHQQVQLDALQNKLQERKDNDLRELNELNAAIDAKQREIAQDQQREIDIRNEMKSELLKQQHLAADLSSVRLQLAFNFVCPSRSFADIEAVENLEDELETGKSLGRGSAALAWLQGLADEGISVPTKCPTQSRRRASLLLLALAAEALIREYGVLEDRYIHGTVHKVEYLRQLTELNEKRRQLKAAHGDVVEDVPRQRPHSAAATKLHEELVQMNAQIDEQTRLLDECCPSQLPKSLSMYDAKRFEQQRACSALCAPIRCIEAAQPSPSKPRSAFVRRRLDPGKSDVVQRPTVRQRYAAAAYRLLGVADGNNSSEIIAAACRYRLSTHRGLEEAVSGRRRPFSARPPRQK